MFQIFIMRILPLLLLLVLAPNSRAEPYVAFILRSHHLAGARLFDDTFGVTFGTRWPAGGTREWHVEGGLFRNSYRETGPLLLAGISTGLGRLGPGQLRGGLSIGAGTYPSLAPLLQDRYAVPRAGPLIPIVTTTLSYRTGRFETRLTAAPADQDVRAVLNLSVAVRF